MTDAPSHSDTTAARERAICRGCGKPLDGDAYMYGGRAYVPHGPQDDHRRPRREAKACHYGGFVCSEACDRRAHLDLEQTMPGHGGQTRLSAHHSEMISRKWAA
ncbi:MAG: hypothetical protein M0Z28_18255 [Rhodospirillales bacterium]|nr:hypothetical protein [Rhodospirillales bacterium]